MVSQSGAILVHLIAACNPQTAQSFDRLRMKSKGAQDDGWGAQSFDRLRMKGKGLRMKSEGLRMMVGGKNEIN